MLNYIYIGGEMMENEVKNDIKAPVHFLICKILGFIALVGGITLIVLACTVLSKPFMDTIQPNIIALMVGSTLSMCSIVLLFAGFIPQFKKMTVKSAKYLQTQNKDDLKEIASTSADIKSEAVTKTAKAVKKGFNDTKFCKKCGVEIDRDSTFCKECGEKQE